ncbi:hypothetical protein ACFSHT_11485 [Paraburkholderia silviterrae]|nr:hypothetical protein [Paraburkholderia silviterrae]
MRDFSKEIGQLFAHAARGCDVEGIGAGAAAGRRPGSIPITAFGKDNDD